MTVFTLLAVGARSSSRRCHLRRKGSPRRARLLQQARKAIDRGLAFLETDAAKWREERKCATCHHGTMTVWALSEAKSQGYAIAAETLTDVTNWTKERLENIDKPRDTRPGWNMVSTPAVYLALMALAVPTQNAVSPDELQRITGHLLRHQESNGSWAWSLGTGQEPPAPGLRVGRSRHVDRQYGSFAAVVPADPVRSRRPATVARVRRTGSKRTSRARARKRRSLELFRNVRAGKPPRGTRAGDRAAPANAEPGRRLGPGAEPAQ